MSFKIKNQLLLLTSMIKELRSSPSILKKKEILLSHTDKSRDLRTVLLKWTSLTGPFNLRSKTILSKEIKEKVRTAKNLKEDLHAEMKDQHNAVMEKSSVIDLLTPLESGNLRGNDAIRFLRDVYTDLDSELTETLSLLVDKTLLCGISQEKIRRILSDEIDNETSITGITNTTEPPIFLPHLPPVLLGITHDKMSTKNHQKDGPFYLSRKLDGIRALTTFTSTEQKPHIFTRSHKRIHPPIEEYFEEDLKSLKASAKDFDFQLDGEICLISEKTGIEDFRSTLSLLSRTSSINLVIPDGYKLIYYVFDLIVPDKTFSERHAILQAIFGNNTISKNAASNNNNNYDDDNNNNDGTNVLLSTKTKRTKVLLLEQTEIVHFSHHKRFIVPMWEGLVLRRSTSKHPLLRESRTPDFIKVKSFKEKEFIVEECKWSTMMVGDRFEENLLSSVRISLSTSADTAVWVGSGFSLEERRMFSKSKRESIVGSTVTVRYFEEFETSLRFPTIKAIYLGGQKRMV